MIEQGRGGRLLAASSVAGETGEPFVTLYGSTKWAIRGLVTSVGRNVLCLGFQAADYHAAKEVGRHGITVNAYAPGVVGKTPLCELRSNAVYEKILTLFRRGGRKSQVF